MSTAATKCLLCNSDAIGIFAFSRGCVCNPATVQPLCLHHVHKATPASGGSMELAEDLTVDGAFTIHWERQKKNGMKP